MYFKYRFQYLGDLDEGDEVFLRPLEDRVQPPAAAEPSKGTLDHPADPGREELPVAVAGDRLDASKPASL